MSRLTARRNRTHLCRSTDRSFKAADDLLADWAADSRFARLAADVVWNPPVFNHLKQLLGLQPSPPPLDDHLWHQTLAATPLLAALPPAAGRQLRGLSQRFLAEKQFYGGDGLVPTLEMQVRIAALACLPVLHLGYARLQPLREVVVYAGEFVTEHSEMDEYGIVHERRRTLSGESWEHGTLVLAWSEVEAAGQLQQGDNVVIHEIAHLLDMGNGTFNGFPPLPAGMDARRWSEDFTAAFEALNACLDAGQTPPIDPYAATEPTEFFAVTSEYHFERPDLLEQAFPAVAEQLRRFYGNA